jgi:hypothetical protein
VEAVVDVGRDEDRVADRQGMTDPSTVSVPVPSST